MVIYTFFNATMKEQSKSTISFFILLTMAIIGATTFILNIVNYSNLFQFIGNEIACIVFIIASVTGVKNEYKANQ